MQEHFEHSSILRGFHEVLSWMVNSNFPGCLITQGILYPDVYKYYTEKYKTWKIK